MALQPNIRVGSETAGEPQVHITFSLFYSVQIVRALWWEESGARVQLGKRDIREARIERVFTLLGVGSCLPSLIVSGGPVSPLVPVGDPNVTPETHPLGFGSHTLR